MTAVFPALHDVSLQGCFPQRQARRRHRVYAGGRFSTESLNVFSFRIESSKCRLKKRCKDSKKPCEHLFSPTGTVFSFKTPTGGSSWERRGKWHGGWYLDSKRLPFPVDRRIAWVSKFLGREFGEFFQGGAELPTYRERNGKPLGLWIDLNCIRLRRFYIQVLGGNSFPFWIVFWGRSVLMRHWQVP